MKTLITLVKSACVSCIIFLNRYNADPAVGKHIYWLGVAGVAVGVIGFIGFAVERRRKR